MNPFRIDLIQNTETDKVLEPSGCFTDFAEGFVEALPLHANRTSISTFGNQLGNRLGRAPQLLAVISVGRWHISEKIPGLSTSVERKVEGMQPLMRKSFGERHVEAPMVMSRAATGFTSAPLLRRARHLRRSFDVSRTERLVTLPEFDAGETVDHQA